ncbi:MAG: hypothetical protein ACE5HE_06425 [Phycisphaerae bacterium]
MTINGPEFNAASSSFDDESARDAERSARVSDEKRALFLNALQRNEVERARRGDAGTGLAPQRQAPGRERAAADRPSSSNSAEGVRLPEASRASTTRRALPDASGAPRHARQGAASQVPIEAQRPAGADKPAQTTPTAVQSGDGPPTTEHVQPGAGASVTQEHPVTHRAGVDARRSRGMLARSGRGEAHAIRQSSPSALMSTPKKGRLDANQRVQSQGDGAELGGNVDVGTSAAAALQAREGSRHREGDSTGGYETDAADTEGTPIHGLTGFSSDASRAASAGPQGHIAHIPSVVLQQMIEFAGVHRNTRGEAEFHLGLAAGFAGGLRLKLTAFGERRFGLKLRCSDKRAIGDLEAQIGALINRLADSDLEIVEVEVAPVG